MRTLTRTLSATAILWLASGALASTIGTRNDGRRPVKLNETTELLGTTVPPGSYDLRWIREAGSETVRLEVAHGKKVVASGKGVWTSSDRPYPHEALVYRKATGANELSEIRFRNSAEWIRVEGTPAGSAAAHGDATPTGGKR